MEFNEYQQQSGNQNIISTIEKLKSKYEVKLIDLEKESYFSDLNIFLRSFQLLNHYHEFDIVNILNLNPGNDDIKIINAHVSFFGFESKGKTSAFGDNLTLGYLNLPIDFGHVLMTPETFTDKVIDFFTRREIDFEENKEFSDKFYLIGTNKELLKTKINRGIQEVLVNYPDIHIEIIGRKLIALFPEKMNDHEGMLALALILETIKKEIQSDSAE
ncbi:MAG: hypothetical protein ACK40G_07405 [Cytophagaceae bacterium]